MAQAGGLVRLYADRLDDRLRGAEMLGPRVEHTAHLLAWVVQQGLGVDRVLELPFDHPLIEEGIRTALRASRCSIVGGTLRPEYTCITAFV
jgi:dihydrolipoamide dehydrogenase